MSANPDVGLVSLPSRHPVSTLVEILKTLLAAAGVELFVVVDHDGGAARAGLRMRPTKLLICGSPRAGTPLMVASPTAAIDMPLKLLVWQDPDGQAWVSYNSPQYLQARHGLPQDLMQNVAGIGAIAARAVQ